jgi:hypothetical protein
MDQCFAGLDLSSQNIGGKGSVCPFEGLKQIMVVSKSVTRGGKKLWKGVKGAS